MITNEEFYDDELYAALGYKVGATLTGEYKVGRIESYDMYVEDKQLVKPVRKIVKPITSAFKRGIISREFAYMLLGRIDLIHIDCDPYRSLARKRPLHKLELGVNA